MPPVVVAVAAGVAAGVAAASVVVGIAAGVAAVALTSALKPDLGSASESLNQAQNLGTGTMQPRRDIYGETLVGGAIVGYGSYEDDDENLHHVMVIPIAAHACESVSVYDIEGQVLAEDPILQTKVALHVKLGDQTTACDVALRYCDGWTQDHIGNGITYVTADIIADPDYFANGVNSIRFKVKGKSVYDPRKDSLNGGSGSHRVNDELTWEWSENPILCSMDYIRFGGYKEQPMSRFDISDISAQANACDELVNYTDENNIARTEKRFTCNGTLAKDQSPSENLKRLLSSMGGKPYNYSGKIYLKAGVYQGTPTMTIDKSMAAGIISYQPHTPIKDRVNLVRTSFVDPKRYYQATDATPTSNDAYRAQDGMTLEQELRLFCTDSETMCQRLGKGFLEQNREGFTINFPLDATGLLLQPGTNYFINLPEDGLSNVEFCCEKVQWDPKKKIVNTIFKKDGSELYPDDFEPNERKRSGNNFISDSFAMPSWQVEDILYTASSDENRNEQGVLSWNYPLQGVSYDVQIQVLNPTFISHTDDRFNPQSPLYDAEYQFEPQYLTVKSYATQDRSISINGLQIGNYRIRLVAKNRSGRQKVATIALVINNEPITNPARFTWRKYKVRLEQPYMTDDPTGAIYEGIAEHQISPIESDDPDDYVWRKIGFDITKERTPIAMYYFETNLTAWSDSEALAGLREALEDPTALPIHGDRIVLVNEDANYDEGKWYHEDSGWTGYVWKAPKGNRSYFPKPVKSLGKLTNLKPVLNASIVLNLDGTLASEDENGNPVNLGLVNKAGLGLANVENKSSAQIRGELSQDNILNAGGETPTGAQDKANSALNNAKAYADTKGENVTLYTIEGLAPHVMPSGSPFAKGFATSVALYHYSSASDLIPVRRGEQLHLEIWAKQLGTTARAYMGIERYDRNKKPISSNSGCVYVGLANTLIAQSWTKYTGSTTLPLTHSPYNGSDGQEVCFVRVRLLFNYQTTGQAYYSGFRLYRHLDKNQVGLDKVENKSSETIRDELTNENIKSATGWQDTPESGATKNTGALANQDNLYDQTQIPMVNSAGALVTISGLSITATTDWEGIASQITISAHTVRFGHAEITYNAGTAWQSANKLVYIYCDDPSYAGGGVSYIATQNKIDLTKNVGRRYVGKIFTPGANGNGGGSAGGGLQP
ncbi:hypothetical protein tloyanaT_26340 [Thalassotalea loyana]|uniref:Tip attachment protein J domain-containing protein n=1 Tax=Thalassotalea loyana TaxID=280483 RepID=A0ABQ6HE52_9GAMM|nr:phage tail protein [Thalassotalea loyana]GLX86381.1 hypothetical protein tloyanaT_26340 [Thalassotalea loyana]